MSDLALGPSEERSRLRSILIAAVVLVTALVVLYFTSWRKQAEVSVVKAEVFAPHTEFKQMKGGGVHVLGAPADSEDNVYLPVRIRYTDKMQIPVFYSSASATMLDEQGASLEATVISASDIPRLEVSFPELTPKLLQPIRDGDEFSPKVAREGTILLLFPGITQDVWAKKKSATMTLHFTHGINQEVPLP